MHTDYKNIEKEYRLKEILDTMPDGFQIISPDWRYLYVNDAVALQGKASKEKLLGAKMMEIYPGIENTEMFGVLKSCMYDRVPKTILNKLQYSDGTSRWFSLKIEPVMEGILILSSDITNLRIAESELSRLNRVYGLLSRINHSIVYIKDSQKLLNTVCDIAISEGKFKIAIVALIDKSSGQLKKVAISGGCNELLDDDYLSSELLSFWISNVREVMRTGNQHFINNIELIDDSDPCRNKFINANCHSNAIFPIKIFNEVAGIFSLFSPEKNFFETKEIALLTEMTQDISFALETFENEKRKVQAENELLKAKENAEEMNKLKSIFLANMSHELRTPLVSILGYAELLSQETDAANLHQMSDTILYSGRRLLETLNSVLDISRIEADKQAVNISSINLNLLLKESLNFFRPIASSKSLLLNLVVPDGPIIIESDRELLLKILSNLLSNAIKYTPQGSVTIKLSKPYNGLLHLVNIEIVDTGIGISETHQEIIFEPFRQVSEGYSRTYDGTGLGLSITEKLVHLLQGEISLVSEPNKGSTFSVKLPVRLQVNEPTHKIEEIPDIIGKVSLPNLPKNLSILLVEDDLSNAGIIESYLKDQVSLEHVIDGFTALDHCRQKKFDVILMDINLKGISGVETFNRIRLLDEHNAHVPVIAITAYAMKGDKQKFLSLGFTDYLSKPFQRSELIILLSNLLYKSTSIL